MATVAVVHHLEQPFLGHAATLRDAGLTLVEYDMRAGDRLPALDTVDAVLTLGGEESVRAGLPHLEREASWLREAVERRMPVLGICLGGQLLAHALGGEVMRLARRDVAWHEVRPATGDPLASALGDPAQVLHWNEDGFTLPPGAVEVLTRTGASVEAFRAGEVAWGLQFHPDVTPEVLDRWYGLEGYLEQAGVSEAVARAADAQHLPAHGAAARRLFMAFAHVVRERRRLDAAPLAG